MSDYSNLTVFGHLQAQNTMTFSQAMEAVRDGQRITKLEWTEPEVYCELRDNLLMIHRNNNWHTWTINDGDIFGTDWVTVNA